VHISGLGGTYTQIWERQWKIPQIAYFQVLFLYEPLILLEKPPTAYATSNAVDHQMARIAINIVLQILTVGH
jgi:hypothetical protein